MAASDCRILHCNGRGGGSSVGEAFARGAPLHSASTAMNNGKAFNVLSGCDVARLLEGPAMPPASQRVCRLLRGRGLGRGGPGLGQAGRPAGPRKLACIVRQSQRRGGGRGEALPLRVAGQPGPSQSPGVHGLLYQSRRQRSFEAVAVAASPRPCPYRGTATPPPSVAVASSGRRSGDPCPEHAGRAAAVLVLPAEAVSTLAPWASLWLCVTTARGLSV